MEIKDINLKFNEEFKPLKRIEKIVIHHTHNPELTLETTHYMHQNRFKWAGIGYNFFIEKDGSIFSGRGLYVGAHAKNHNDTSIGIGIAGNFDVSLPNEEQMNSLIELVLNFMKEYDIEPAKVIGHREIPGVEKSCPGNLFDMNEFRKCLKLRLNK